MEATFINVSRIDIEKFKTLNKLSMSTPIVIDFEKYSFLDIYGHVGPRIDGNRKLHLLKSFVISLLNTWQIQILWVGEFYLQLTKQLNISFLLRIIEIQLWSKSLRVKVHWCSSPNRCKSLQLVISWHR